VSAADSCPPSAVGNLILFRVGPRRAAPWPIVDMRVTRVVQNFSVPISHLVSRIRPQNSHFLWTEVPERLRRSTPSAARWVSDTPVTTTRGSSLPVNSQQQRCDGYALQEAGERIYDLLRERRVPRQDVGHDVGDCKKYKAQAGHSIKGTWSTSPWAATGSLKA
jgi:hypothetical protein